MLLLLSLLASAGLCLSQPFDFSANVVTLNGAFSYAEYDQPVPLNDGELTFLFRTQATAGLFFYQESSTTDDFISLTLQNSRLQLQVNLGKGTEGSTGEFGPYADGKIHEMVLRRSEGGKLTELLIDSKVVVSVSSPDDEPGLDIEGPLYFGGFEPSVRPVRNPTLRFFARLAACIEPMKTAKSVPDKLRGAQGVCEWCVPSQCANTRRCFDNPVEGCDCRESGYGGKQCTEGEACVLRTLAHACL